MKRAKILMIALLLPIVAIWLLTSSPASAASAVSNGSTCGMLSSLSSGDPLEGCYRPSDDASGMRSDPAFVEDTDAGSCMNWHISINSANPQAWCAENMPGRVHGDYILLTFGSQLNEYQITEIDTPHQSVSVQFVQKWVPDGTKQHPYLLRLYPGVCSDVWRVEGLGTDPFCTITMPIVSQGQYVEVAGADLSGEYIVQSVNLSGEYIVIG